MNLNASVVDCRAWGTGTCPTGVPQSSAGRSTKSATRSRVTKVPTAPTSVTAHLTGDRVEVHWTAPDWPGSAPIHTYRAKVYRWVTGKHVYTRSCTSSGPTFTCTTDLTGTGGLLVRVTAKNKHGYGTPTTYIPVSQAQAAGQ